MTLGVRVLHKVETIVREEMDRAGIGIATSECSRPMSRCTRR